MDSREFAEWMAFAQLEPLGDRRGDWQAALVAATVANTSRDPKKRKEPFSPEEFLLDWAPEKREPERQTWQEQLRVVQMLNVAFGGRDLRKGERQA